MSHPGLACARLKDCLANARIFSIWKPAEKIEARRTDSYARVCECVWILLCVSVFLGWIVDCVIGGDQRCCLMETRETKKN